MNHQRKIDVNPFNSIGSILILVLILVGLFFLAKSVFTILQWLAPFLLILALILNYKVVINYGKWLVNLFKSNILMGLGASLLTVVGFPVIAGFLAVKAYLYRKVDMLQTEMENRQKGEYVDFEEVDDFPEKRLQLPEIEVKPKSRSNDSEYDQYFE